MSRGDDAVPPRSFARFEIRGELGGGGQGVVYRAWDPERRREVALKVLHDAPGTVARERLRLAREAAFFAADDDASLVKPLDTGVHDHATWVTYELIDGMTLREVLARLRATGRSPDRIDAAVLAAAVPLARRGESLVAFACRVTMEAAFALGALHARGVAHGDVKPSNLMIDGEGTARVIDLGLAVAEHAAGGGREAIEDDVTRLGLVLFELLTLIEPPRAGRASAGVAALTRPRRHHRGLDRAVDAICAAAISADPARRYVDVRDFATDLGAALSGAPVGVHVPSARQRAAAAVREHSLALLVSGVVLLVLAAGGVWARSAARRALDAERIAEERSLAILGLSDELWMDELEQRSAELFPAVPSRLDALDAWLAAAAALGERLVGHRDDRARLRSAGGDAASADDVTRFRAARLDVLLAREPGFVALVEDVRARRRFAAELHERSIDAHRATWEQARRDVLADPRFGGLELPPQLGLVPLARNASTGLWEFLVLGTSASPDDEDAATGVVLVLVPGGEAWFAHGGSVVVEPFFIARTEMTQAQWIARRGENPSWHAADGPAARSLPVESVSFDECERVLFEIGLGVPSDAEWEWAARGGTTTAWYTGDDFEGLEGHANLADATVARAIRDARIKTMPWDDGHYLTAPVASFEPNPFGLFDVIGNVNEWTSDPRPPPAAEGVDVVAGGSLDFRAIRGGCYTSDADAARPDAGRVMRRNERLPSLGVRPSRRVDP